MNNGDIKILHSILLDIYKEFERICNENNLKYFAIAGTVLGAIRHKGFIPWDDDLDVGMPIEDYIKFKKIAKEQLRQPYIFIDNLDKTRSKNFFCKIENANTTFVESKSTNNFKGIWIDIFPFSGIPENKIKKYLFLKKSYLYLSLDWNLNHSFKNCIDIKSKVFKVLGHIFSLNRNNTVFLEKFEKMLIDNSFYSSNEIFYAWKVSLSYKKSYDKMVFPANIFKNIIDQEFENTFIRIPEGYDEYLRKCYGDYLVIPPKEKQKIHNPYIFDVNKSYKVYEAEWEEKNDKKLQRK